MDASAHVHTARRRAPASQEALTLRPPLAPDPLVVRAVLGDEFESVSEVLERPASLTAPGA